MRLNNRFLLTFRTDDNEKEEETEVLNVIGNYAEALESANTFLNSCYYNWEIIDLRIL